MVMGLIKKPLRRENEMKIARAVHKSASVTPRKARLLRAVVMGKSVPMALALLRAERRAGAAELEKVIRSAFTQVDPTKGAIVADVVINEGTRRSSFMPRAQGRASPIVKRLSHIGVVLLGSERTV
jgi:large subunit ribosomal protein L22